MMRFRAYAIRDSKAQAFQTPYFFQNDGIAVRSVHGEVRDNPQSQLNRFPEDFALYHIGEFDDEKGILVSAEPTMVVQCLNLKDKSL